MSPETFLWTVSQENSYQNCCVVKCRAIWSKTPNCTYTVSENLNKGVIIKIRTLFCFYYIPSKWNLRLLFWLRRGWCWGGGAGGVTVLSLQPAFTNNMNDGVIVYVCEWTTECGVWWAGAGAGAGAGRRARARLKIHIQIQTHLTWPQYTAQMVLTATYSRTH